jgi:methyl-accepting chemotaxis protein
MKKTTAVLFITINALLLAALVLTGGNTATYAFAGASFLFNLIAILWLNGCIGATLADLGNLASSIASNKFDYKLSGSSCLDTTSLGETLSSMEHKLKERLSMDEAMLNNLVVPMAIVDPKGNIQWLNEPMVMLTENTGAASSFLGKPFSEFFYGDRRETLSDKAVSERKKQLSKTEFDTRKGNHKYISIAATPVQDFDGRLIGGFVSVADFTNVVLKEKFITEQNQRIAQAVKDATEVAQRVAQAASEMEEQIDQTSRGMESQRAQTGELALGIEEMNTTIREVARTAADAAETASKANETTLKGTEVVNKVISIMGVVNAKAEGLKSEMGDLGVHAKGIGQIMQVISDIADQTNLLALNAAIEAARAGDAGRGFAVVADEVRKLAEKTMTATKEVASYITSIQESAKRNMDSTDDTTRVIAEAESQTQVAGDALRQILDFVLRTSDQVREIASAAEQQSAASAEINRSTHSIKEIAGTTAETMSQAASAVAQLAHLATDLESAMTHMRED